MYFTDYNGDTLKLELWCWINNLDPKNFIVAKDKIIQEIHDVITPVAEEKK